MPRLLVDEDFGHRIVRGLRARLPSVDLVTVHEAGLGGRHDREVLAWAAEQGRVLLTHDVTTMTRFAYERVAAGLAMPGWRCRASSRSTRPPPSARSSTTSSS